MPWKRIKCRKPNIVVLRTYLIDAKRSGLEWTGQKGKNQGKNQKDYWQWAMICFVTKMTMRFTVDAKEYIGAVDRIGKLFGFPFQN